MYILYAYVKLSIQDLANEDVRHLIAEIHEIEETKSRLEMPLGVGNRRVTPRIPGINILPQLEIILKIFVSVCSIQLCVYFRNESPTYIVEKPILNNWVVDDSSLLPHEGLQ